MIKESIVVFCIYGVWNGRYRKRKEKKRYDMKENTTLELSSFLWLVLTENGNENIVIPKANSFSFQFVKRFGLDFNYSNEFKIIITVDHFT